MLHQEQLSARAENPVRFAHRAPVVGDRAERKGENHGVEARIGKLEGLGIADSKVDLAPELVRSLTSEFEHWGAEIDAGQAHIRRIVGKVPARTDADV
jgi:hypothetical protein